MNLAVAFLIVKMSVPILVNEFSQGKSWELRKHYNIPQRLYHNFAILNHYPVNIIGGPEL